MAFKQSGFLLLLLGSMLSYCSSVTCVRKVTGSPAINTNDPAHKQNKTRHTTHEIGAPIGGRTDRSAPNGDTDADEPAEEGGGGLPVATRRLRPRQARPLARGARRARRRRGLAPRRRRRRPAGAGRRALFPQHRRAGDHVSGRHPGARGGGAAESGLHAGGIRVLPVRLRGAPPPHERRGQRRGAGGRREARPGPRRREPQGRRRPGPPRRNPGRQGPRPTGRLRQRPFGRGAVPAHLRHDEPAQGGPPDAAQPGGVRPEHPRRVPPRRDGRDGDRAPAVPRARPHVRAPGLAGVGRRRGAPRRGPVLGVHVLGRHARVGRHVVHRRADHPPDHPRPPRVPAGARVPAAPLHPQLQRVAGAVDPGEARGVVRRAGAGGVRDDGGVAPDDDEPAARGRRPEARVRGPARGAAGAGDPRRGGREGGRRGARRGVRAGRERDGGVQEQRRGERGGVPVRVVPHGRHRRGGRGRVPAPGGPHQGAHQPRRREDLADRGRLRAARPPGHRAGRRVRRARRQVRRGDQLRGDPAGRGGAGRGGRGGVLPEEPGGVQGAEEGIHRRRPAQDGHGEDPAAHRRAALRRAGGQGLDVFC